MPIGGLGFWEILLIFVVLLLVFGAKRLPELGGALGKGIREFKGSIRDIEGELKRPSEDTARDVRPADRKPALPGGEPTSPEAAERSSEEVRKP